MTEAVPIGDTPLTVADVVSVAYGAPVTLDLEARQSGTIRAEVTVAVSSDAGSG